MSKPWVISDETEVKPGWSCTFVSKAKNVHEIQKPEKIKRLLIDDSFFKFSLVYSDVTKMLGYRFDYRNNRKSVLNGFYKDFNTMLWFYTKESAKSKRKFEVLYEDQVVRLLMFDQGKDGGDYWLVGRWREDNTNEVEK